MSVPAEVMAAYRECDRIARLGIPYVYGAGHPDMDLSKGADCSSAVSRPLYVAGILEHTYALDTHALERWGFGGRGRWMTVWAINTADLKHCWMEFYIPGLHRYFAARHTGTIVGWQKPIDPTGYTPRRRKA